MVDSNGHNLECIGVSRSDVLREVSLELTPGRCAALVGPSGAGKTTLLWILARLWQPTSGRVVTGTGRIGMVFQNLALWDHLTVEQHLCVVGATETARERMLERMRLAGLRRRRPDELSGGEQQRVAMARALVVDPDWLLLDEPMAHLDGSSRCELFELLREAIESISAGVLIATHHAEEAMSLADELAVLIDGRIVQHGTPEIVYRNPVSLDAARALGPASNYGGRIVRPEDMAFSADPSGPGRVERCAFVGAAYLLHVCTDEGIAICRSKHAFAPNTRGRVVTSVG